MATMTFFRITWASRISRFRATMVRNGKLILRNSSCSHWPRRVRSWLSQERDILLPQRSSAAGRASSRRDIQFHRRVASTIRTTQ